MPKKTIKKALSSSFVSLPLVNPNAAGIDIGDTLHAVAVPPGRDEHQVQTFGTMTCDLEEIVIWLKNCQVETVAMESTGVYWKPLFTMLVQNGFEVYLVDAKRVRNVTGRKNDQTDAQWLQQLHSCGLLNSCYLPDEAQEALRTLTRYRKCLVGDSSRFVLRMQKALELMNIKLHTVIRDITGKTGIAILEAIIGGERKAENFLPFVDRGIKADHATIVASLQGNWREEHLFTLAQSYQFYQFYQQRIASCDLQIERQLQQLNSLVNTPEPQVYAPNAPTAEVALQLNSKQPKKKKNKNSPRFDIRTYLKSIHGVDVVAIYGISDTAALEILAETGTNLSKWPTQKHFVSWLNLCPNNKISGGKLISSMLMKKKANTASQAFRSAANAVQKSDHWLGDYFRRMRAKGGNKYAVVATAHKIATIYYKMVRYKQEFTPLDLFDYQQKYKLAKIAFLERKLEQLKKQAA